MIPKELRLKRASDFAYIAKKGSSVRSENLSIRFIRAKEGGQRFGIVITGKNDKRAVRRNLLKRRIRAILMANKGIMPEHIKMFVQVKGKESIVRTDFVVVKEELEGLLSKISQK